MGRLTRGQGDKDAASVEILQQKLDAHREEELVLMSHQLEGLRNNERGLHRYCPGARYLPLRRGKPALPPCPASVRRLSLTARSCDIALVEEMVRVADAFQLCDVTVHLAVNYLDRLLVRSAGHARRAALQDAAPFVCHSHRLRSTPSTRCYVCSP